uniref:Uncharacterized protein n=1 Tax=Aegilops tauschii subsp. strangulata TaxID=200361 RepID=A0A453L8G0_AEGTS
RLHEHSFIFIHSASTIILSRERRWQADPSRPVPNPPLFHRRPRSFSLSASAATKASANQTHPTTQRTPRPRTPAQTPLFRLVPPPSSDDSRPRAP